MAASCNTAANSSTHSRQVKKPASLSRTASAKACACQGSANTGPSASRGMASVAANAATPSGRLKIVLPQIETDAIARTGGIAPKGACLELDGIERLRIFPLELRIAVGEHVRAMQGNDYAQFVTCIPRQARVRERMDVAGAHRIARTVSRLTFSTPRGRAAA